MSLPSAHIMPSSAFRHIGVMVMFMYIMACFSLIGFLSVKNITQGWTTGFHDTLTVEIPAFDVEMNYVFDEAGMKQDVDKIRNYLKNDPLVIAESIKHDGPLTTGIDDLDIPAPYFLTLSLRQNRVEGAEARLVSNMRRIVPHIMVHEQEAWEKEINRTAFIFQTVFCGLALGIFIVTSIVLSGVIRTQLKAAEETVRLVHLLGASVKSIAALFKKSVSRAVCGGVFVGAFVTFFSLFGLLPLLGLEGHLYEFYIYLAIIGLIFIGICRLITVRTVLSALRGLP